MLSFHALLVAVYPGIKYNFFAITMKIKIHIPINFHFLEIHLIDMLPYV